MYLKLDDGSVSYNLKYPNIGCPALSLRASDAVDNLVDCQETTNGALDSAGNLDP